MKFIKSISNHHYHINTYQIYIIQQTLTLIPNNFDFSKMVSSNPMENTQFSSLIVINSSYFHHIPSQLQHFTFYISPNVHSRTLTQNLRIHT